MGKRGLTKIQINKIINLRKQGCSLPEIRRITHHGIGTIFKYIKGVKILPQFQEFWKNKRKSSRWRSLQQWEKAREEAKKLIRKIRRKDRIIIATCLYWAEGAKRDFSFSNTDPFLIRTFIESLKELGINKDRLSINLRIYEDLDKERVIDFWSKITGISRKRIKYINVLKGKKRGKLSYGMCRVRVEKGGYFLKLLHTLQDIIKNDICPRSLMEKTADS